MVDSDSDSSSDSNEDLKKFADAIYPEFKIIPTRNAGQNGEVSQCRKQNEKSKKSKRVSKSEEWETGHFVHPLKLTPSSQEFVSKQLSMSLDKKIKETEAKNSKLDANPEEDSGIFLFQSSTRKIRGKDLRKYETRSRKKVKRVRKESDSESEDDTKLLSVAVDAEWVLNPKTV